MTYKIWAATLALGLIATFAVASNPRQAILDGYAASAGGALSADAGQSLFLGNHTGGNPDTPSCTTCHTKDPHNQGLTRVGKPIAPMAVSLTPDRFTDPAKVEKWFLRNCNTVLGRECSAQEKGDIISYLASI